MTIQKRKMAGLDVAVAINGMVIGGQVDADLTREALVIDTTSKDTGDYSTAMTRIKKWYVECAGFTLINDESYGLLLDAFEAGTKLDLEINHKSYKHFYYRGQVIVTEFPESYQAKDAVKYTLSLLGVSKLERHRKTEEE